jgi:arylsulfatase
VSEAIDLASQHPEKLSELIALWWDEARGNDVLPLDNRPLEAIAHPRPDRRRQRSSYRYFQGGAPVPEPVAIKLCNRSHEIAVAFDVPDSVVPNGVLVALGCALGGWSLHVVDGQLRYVHNLYGKRRTLLRADRLLGSGRHDVKFAFEKDGGPGGSAVLEHAGEVVAGGSIDRFTPAVFNEVGIGLTCGYEWGPAVGEGYSAPFAFNGTILRADVAATGPMVVDPVLEVAAILAMQ